MSPALNRYQPSDQEPVHVTVEATYLLPFRGQAAGYVTAEQQGSVFIPDNDAIVDVEPAPRHLPRVPGSMIVARIPGADRPDLLVLRPVSDRESGETTRWPDGSMVWESNGNGWIDGRAIAPGWVEIDPATLRPTEATA